MSLKQISNRLLCTVAFAVLVILSGCKGETAYEHGGHESTDHEMGEVSELVISPNRHVISRQATVKLSSSQQGQIYKAGGVVEPDRSRNAAVSARYGGRIVRLYVKYELQWVKKGDRVMDIYSPELKTYQEEHLLLLRTTGGHTLVEQSREKLGLLGLSKNQVNDLETSGKVSSTVTVYSPSNGYVFFDTEKNTPATGSQTTGMDGMGATVQPEAKSYSTGNNAVKEGMYINTGQLLFTVNDLSSVWVILYIPSEHVNSLYTSHPVMITSELFPDKPFPGTISTVEKVFEEENQRFARARVTVSNPGQKLKINSLLWAEVPLRTTSSYIVPSSAVYSTGMQQVVWVKTDTTASGSGIFELRKVVAGTTTNGYTTILTGLRTGEEVAKHAAYMADSETFLNY